MPAKPDNFNDSHWAYTLGWETGAGLASFTPGRNGHKPLDSFDPRALAHYYFGRAQGRNVARRAKL